MKSYRSYFANGKLLLTGEYFILDGALSLAVPCKFGQRLDVFPKQNPSIQKLEWISRDEKEISWFEAELDTTTMMIHRTTEITISSRLVQIMKALEKQNPQWREELGGRVVTKVNFPRAWGLGTSSTLIALTAQWFKVDPFILLADSFGGSGYDIACALAQGPILFQKHQHLPAEWLKGGSPEVDGHFVHYPFNPSFKEQLFFVYLGKKQNSRLGIQHYRKKVVPSNDKIQTVSNLTAQLIQANQIEDFERIILEHERFISKQLGLQQVKEMYFQDYWGAIKSLGAWGGDFVLATSNQGWEMTTKYFCSKGLTTVLPYDQMVLTNLT